MEKLSESKLPKAELDMERFGHDILFAENVVKKPYARIGSSAYKIPGLLKKWRVTYQDAGPKAQVINSVAYPDISVSDAPILGIDLLTLGNKRHLAVYTPKIPPRFIQS